MLETVRPAFSHRLWSRLSSFGAYAPVAMLFLIGLPMLSLSRIALMLWQSDRVAATGIWPEMLMQGIRVDIIQLSLLALPPILLAPVLATGLTWRFWRRLSAFWIILSIGLLALLEVASPAFINEYDARPNRLFVEYLKYPGEVFPMLWNGFRLHLVAGSLLTAFAFWGMARATRPWLERERS